MHPSPRFSLFLILLLVLNSSQVLAVAVHDSHGHGAALSPGSVTALQAEQPAGAIPDTNFIGHAGAEQVPRAPGATGVMAHESLAHDAVPDASQSPATPGEQAVTAADHDQSDDCLCAELCCASTVGFATLSSGAALPAPRSTTTPLPDYYQSVSLDLLLPPPNP